MSSLSLGLEHVSKAISDSVDHGETLDLTKWDFTEVSHSSVIELSKIGAEGGGIVTR